MHEIVIIITNTTTIFNSIPIFGVDIDRFCFPTIRGDKLYNTSGSFNLGMQF